MLTILAVVVALLFCIVCYATSELIGDISDIDYRLCELEDIVDNMRRRQEDDGK